MSDGSRVGSREQQESEASGAVVVAKGFRASGIAAGLKQEGLDLALIVADKAVPAAAVFTDSSAAAPPVLVSREQMRKGAMKRAVILTSGRANAGTGDAGMQLARGTVAAVAAELGCDEEEILVCSTGVIGLLPPLDPIKKGLPVAVRSLARTPAAGHTAARAIMTTDTRPKEAQRAGAGYTIGGMTKGAGMIRPNMATMLAVITTDASVAPFELSQALRSAVDASFNAINIDGCQSTNDSVVIFASGESRAKPDPTEFTALLTDLCAELALKIVQDAECAHRVVTLKVSGAASDRDACELGKFVADSDLVRSSFYGGDPNWGRIIAALGASPIAPDISRVSIAYEGVATCLDGGAISFDEEALYEKLASGDFTIEIRVGRGPGASKVLTCDLTPEYVSYNGKRS